ncbi:hypothetical protein CPB97_005752, partial [Podila verticillata]
MEKRTLRSSTRAAAAAAASTGVQDDKNSDGAPTTTTGAGAGKFKGLYKPNPIAKTAKEGINKRVSDDVKLRKQRRDELVSTKRFKRSDDAKETTDEEGELTKEQVDAVDEQLKSGSSDQLALALKTLSDYLTQFPESDDLQTFVSSADFLATVE